MVKSLSEESAKAKIVSFLKHRLSDAQGSNDMASIIVYGLLGRDIRATYRWGGRFGYGSNPCSSSISLTLK